MTTRLDLTGGRIRDLPWLNAFLGIWLVLSAFLWEHSTSERINTVTVGALCVVVALGSLRAPAVRWMNVALSAWLFVSVWVLPGHNRATMWNNAFVALCVFMIALDSGVPDDAHAVHALTSGRR